MSDGHLSVFPRMEVVAALLVLERQSDSLSLSPDAGGQREHRGLSLSHTGASQHLNWEPQWYSFRAWTLSSGKL